MTSHCSLIFVSLTTIDFETFLHILMDNFYFFFEELFIHILCSLSYFFLLKKLIVAFFLLILLILHTSDTLQTFH